MTELSAIQGYAAATLDRVANVRDRPDQIAAWQGSPDALTCLFAGDVPVLVRGPAGVTGLMPLDEARRFGSWREPVLLGLRAGTPIFAARLDDVAADAYQAADPYLMVDLRTLAQEGALPPAELNILAQGKSLTHWHRRHRFCANCGTATEPAAGGWRRECAACGTHHFPRTDPVAIMLVARGDRCLLARQRRFPPGVYSCLAGFVEPGETLEDAVRREVMEEAGVLVGEVSYLATQPWPFPSSLMIGCVAKAESESLTIDYEELEDGRWFSRDEVRLMLARAHPGGFLTPPPLAIAHHLLRHFAGRDQA